LVENCGADDQRADKDVEIKPGSAQQQQYVLDGVDQRGTKKIPSTLPRPPLRERPPITHAAMAWSSRPAPPTGVMLLTLVALNTPESAAIPAARANATSLTWPA
jgi:hypothetical protein